MKVVITGAHGFIGKNLVSRLQSESGLELVEITRQDSLDEFHTEIIEADWIVHLAGVNRPESDDEFQSINVGYTSRLCDIASNADAAIPIIFASSTQAENQTQYGKSKLSAENILKAHASDTGCNTLIYRLPGIFGKWCRPNYNSVVATFCHNISHGLPIRVDDETTSLSLNYIDDVVEDMLSRILGEKEIHEQVAFLTVEPLHEISLRSLVSTLEGFRDNRNNLQVDQVGSGLKRALYATYISYLDVEDFSYEIAFHSDDRGRFVEFVKTRDSGQVSYFTAGPGVSRGQHYHHTKTEKFLVVQGEACFRFRQLHTERFYEQKISSDDSRIIESIPGWAHDVTNTGESELIILVWASEVFDRNRPDTIPEEV